MSGSTGRESGLDLGEGAASREARDDRVAELSGEGLSFRTNRADVDRDRRFTKVAELVALKADLVDGSVQCGVDLVSVQQRSYHSDIFPETRDGHRALADRPHRSVAGTEPQERPARREPVDRRNAVGDNRRKAQARDRETRTEPNGAGSLGGEREDSERVRVHQLRIGCPAILVPEFLGPDNEVDVIDRLHNDSELHQPNLTRTHHDAGWRARSPVAPSLEERFTGSQRTRG